MKKVTALVLGLFAVVFSVNAASENTNHFLGTPFNGQSYIFVEGGVEFSVFPDGQFDFVYVGRNQGSNVNVSINTPNVNIAFNSGYNYDAYVQYDDYGAVIQIEDVPIYYDEFGRIAQAGSVEIRYTNRRIVRVGGMNIFYNNYGYFTHYTGFISPWYTTYIYRPWHVFYTRPFYSHCIVYDYPYRRYYSPLRYSYAYHRKHFRRGHRYYRNSRRDFARVGSRIHHRNGRYSVNRDFRANRENTAARYNKRRDRNDIASNTRPSNNYNSKGRPINSTRPKVDRENKGRPTTTINRGKPTNTKPSYNGTVSRGKPKVDRTKPSYNTTSKGRPNVNSNDKKVTRGKPSYTKPKVNRAKPQITKRSSNVKRNTTVKRSSNTKMRSTTSSNRKSSASRGNSTRRGRG